MSDAIPDSAAGVKTALTRKLGPFPAFVWGLLVVGAAYAVYFYRKRTGTTSKGILGNLTGTSGSGSGSVTGADGNLLTATTPAAGSGANSTATVTTPLTNAQWALATANQMSVQGMWANADVSTALSDYLNGNTLTPNEQQIVNYALQNYGNPPQGLIPVNSSKSALGPFTTYVRDGSTGAAYGVYADGTRHQLSPTEYAALGNPPLTEYQSDPNKNVLATWGQAGTIGGAAADAAKQFWSAGHNYTTQVGDTYASIASSFYGNSARAADIQAANPGVTTLVPGTVIAIPA